MSMGHRDAADHATLTPGEGHVERMIGSIAECLDM